MGSHSRKTVFRPSSSVRLYGATCLTDTVLTLAAPPNPTGILSALLSA